LSYVFVQVCTVHSTCTSEASTSHTVEIHDGYLDSAGLVLMSIRMQLNFEKIGQIIKKSCVGASMCGGFSEIVVSLQQCSVNICMLLSQVQCLVWFWLGGGESVRAVKKPAVIIASKDCLLMSQIELNWLWKSSELGKNCKYSIVEYTMLGQNSILCEV